MEERKAHRKERIGVVVSDKMEKTIVVRVDTMSKHPLYGKPVRRFKKYKAHDEENTCRTGDKVRIEETRPLSRHKCWRLAEVLERAPILTVTVPGKADEIAEEEK
ncbi:MAG: 30S ribosomal protein S17 [Synergistales bacterium]|jgi:small subunit ribosomal protein S17|nr:30S ribosomal protein S17 [Synergistales bacterium]